MRFVIDASVAAKWILPGEPWEEKANMLKKAIALGRVEAYAPTLLTYELASVLLKAVKKSVLKALDGIEALKAISFLGINLAPVLWKEVAEVFETASSSGLTIYDAAYLWLSKKLDADLITADEKLRKKGEKITKVLLLEEVKI